MPSIEIKTLMPIKNSLDAMIRYGYWDEEPPDDLYIFATKVQLDDYDDKIIISGLADKEFIGNKRKFRRFLFREARDFVIKKMKDKDFKCNGKIIADKKKIMGYFLKISDNLYMIPDSDIQKIKALLKQMFKK